MKKFIIFFVMCILMSNHAMAKWGKHHRYHKHHKSYYATDVAAGIVGTTVGILIADELIDARNARRKNSKPRVYIAEPEGKCYTVVSRKTGKIRQECVDNASDDIIYVD